MFAKNGAPRGHTCYMLATIVWIWQKIRQHVVALDLLPYCLPVCLILFMLTVRTMAPQALPFGCT